MDNLKIYNATREVPSNAMKTIGGGRLKGMTDINPMWRIKSLTEQFGAVGFGWYYKIIDQHLETSPETNEIAAFVTIELYIKQDGEWSMPIVGVGGSNFVTKESTKFYMSDECFKMALTDSISVTCKALGFGADVYWDKDKTKYDAPPKANTDSKPKADNTEPETSGLLSEGRVKRLYAIAKSKGRASEVVTTAVKAHYKVDHVNQLSLAQYEECIKKYEAL